MIDQGFVSLANFGLGIVVARLVSPTEFGAFGLAFAFYLVMLSIARGFATQPLAIRFGGRDPAEFRRGAAQATGVALTIGLAGSAVCLAVAILVSGVQGGVLIALAASLPGLLVQDAWRFTLFTSRRGSVAVVNDLLAVVVMAVLIGLVVAFGTASVFAMVLCWGFGAATAAIVGVIQTRVRPMPTLSLSWFREHWDITPRFLGSEVLLAVGAQAFLFAIGALIGLAAVGSVRGAQLLLGPVYIMSVSAHMTMVPELSRMVSTPARFQRITHVSSGALLLVGIGWGLVVLLLPDAVGQEILGESWPGARSVLLPIALSIIIPLASVGPRIGLRALEEASRALRAGIAQFVLTLSGGIGGALIYGTVGAAWGLVLGTSLAGVWMYVEFWQASRHHVARIELGGDTTSSVGQVPSAIDGPIRSDPPNQEPS